MDDIFIYNRLLSKTKKDPLIIRYVNYKLKKYNLINNDLYYITGRGFIYVVSILLEKNDNTIKEIELRSELLSVYGYDKLVQSYMKKIKKYVNFK